ncbi:MAG: hypothetical protein AAF790_09470 [Planctomycetota bacterium]
MTVYELWLPILLAGLAVHVCSTLAWVVLPHHKPEWTRLEGEDDLIDWLDARGVPVGQYVFPFAADHDGTSEKFKSQAARCRGTLVLWPHVPSMGKNIALTLTHFLAAAAVIGYLASLALSPGDGFWAVFQFTAVAGVLTHVFCGLSNVIWFRRKVLMDLIDGAVYAAVTGLVFASLWPGAAG